LTTSICVQALITLDGTSKRAISTPNVGRHFVGLIAKDPEILLRELNKYDPGITRELGRVHEDDRPHKN